MKSRHWSVTTAILSLAMLAGMSACQSEQGSTAASDAPGTSTTIGPSVVFSAAVT